MPDPRLWWRILRPGLLGAAGLVLAAAAAAVGVLLTILAARSIDLALFTLYLFAVVPASVIVWLSAFGAGRPAAKMVMFHVALWPVVIGLPFGFGPQLLTQTPGTVFGMAVLVGGPLLLAMAPAAFAWTLAGVGDIADARQLDREDRAITLLCERARSLAEVGTRVGLSSDAVAALVSRCLEDRTLIGRLEEDIGWFVPFAEVHAGQEGLLDAIRSRGEARLADLATTLKVPERLVHRWLYELVYRERFRGWINWRDGVVYAEAAGLVDKSRCPSCAGPLGVAPGGVARCRSCGTDVLRGVGA